MASRYNREALEIRYKGTNIADVLDMTVDEALDFFSNIPRIRNKLQTLSDVGLGYVRLGQPATTLSGGEAQRIKLSKELSRRATGRTFYILDEPTTGLHFADIERLLKFFTAWSITATPSSSSSTTSTSSRPATGSSISAPKAATWAARSSPRAPPKRSPALPAPIPASTSSRPASSTPSPHRDRRSGPIS